MIFESGPWKEDLSSYHAKIIEYGSLKYFQNDGDESENAYSILEKSILIICNIGHPKIVIIGNSLESERNRVKISVIG